MDAGQIATLLLAAGAFVTGVAALLGLRNTRNKPRVDSADASDKLSESGVRLSDAALRYAAISEAKAKELMQENEELTERLNALVLSTTKQQADFQLELAAQQAKITMLEARVTYLEGVVVARETAIGERDRIIAGLREQSAEKA